MVYVVCAILIKNDTVTLTLFSRLDLASSYLEKYFECKNVMAKYSKGQHFTMKTEDLFIILREREIKE